MKKIVIDARLSGLKHAGIGRYTQMLCEHLNDLRFTCPQTLRAKCCRLAIYDLRMISPDIRHYTLAEQIKMPIILAKEKPDLAHFPHFNVPLLYNSPFVVTIHDLLWHEQVGTTATTLPVWIYWLKYFAYRLVLRHAVLSSRTIIVPSNWVKKKIVERFPEVSGKIQVIYEGVVQSFITDGRSAVGNETLAKYNLHPKQYLIYTGSLYPHKNVEPVLNVVQHLINLKFVVCCSRSMFWERFKKYIERKGLKDRVVLAGFVPDDELAILYKNALAFVFPSNSEGFGLPGLEAMAAECPVISSNAGALPEIYGDAALYFDPKSDIDLRIGIEKVRKDKRYREELIRKGKERAKKFTWEKMAKETMEVYAGCFGIRQGK
ncbi:glycosyltransferase family 4 protein [Candidatus Collierbacteria bacterium]|nr:glycosyltransferase family 4 protein [Candidatus Collierbacteria bacterium]